MNHPFTYTDRKFKNREDRKVPVGSYEPNSREECIVWEIARHVEDTDMRPLLKVLRHHGLSVIERAFEEFRLLEDDIQFTNKPGFFMNRVQKHIAKKGGDDK